MFVLLSFLFLATSIYLFIPYWKHRRSIKKFHSFYLVTEEKPELEVVYVDRTGNKWYGFKNMMKAPAKRITEAEAMNSWAELCMTPDYFAIEMNKAIAFMNKGKYNQAGGIMNELLIRATWAAERVTLQMLTNVLYMIEGENPLMPSEEYLEKKKEIWAKDPECEAFFLTIAINNIRLLRKLSEADLMTYLREKELTKQLTKASLLSNISQPLPAK